MEMEGENAAKIHDTAKITKRISGAKVRDHLRHLHFREFNLRWFMHCTDEMRLAQRNRPAGFPVMHNRWTNLLFLHWRIEPEIIQSLLPPGLIVDCFDGAAWIGVVPFGMERIRPVFCPPMPGISWFLELNLRTYVIDEQTGIPGVWFFSLDASSALACATARKFFSLPYFHARMSCHRDTDKWLNYESQLREEPKNQFLYRASTKDPTLRHAEIGTLEFFLLERYVLFAWNAARKQLSMGRVFHDPYEVCTAEVAEQSCASLFKRAALRPPERQPQSTLYAPKVQTLIFPLKKLS